MKLKKLFILVAAITMLLTTACSSSKVDNKNNGEGDAKAKANVNETGMPIVKDEIELNMFVGSVPGANDWNDIMIWNKYAEMTNIKVNFEQVPSDSLVEKRNLVLASNKYPDVFYAADLTPLDVLKYGEQGTFVKLNDLIDKYAPNIKKLFEQYPDVKKALTFPDGSIYSLPGFYDPEFSSLIIGNRPWFNQTWLDKLGMENPKTTDEFYEYLKAVKEKDPAGNGKSIGYGGRNIADLVGWLRGSFGVATTARNYIDLDPKTEKVRFYPTSDGYKEMLMYINKLYSEGLIEKGIFSIEQSKYLANAAEGVYGSTVFWTPEDLFGKAGKEFVGGLALEGPHGDKKFAFTNYPAYSIGKFAMTSANKNPEATMRWIDYFYGEEGSRLMFMGIEGETYEVTKDGKYQYMDHILNSKDGLTLDQEIAKYLTWVVGVPALLKQDYFKGSEASPSALESAKHLEGDFVEEMWPAFLYTKDESRTLAPLEADIHKYADEMRDKFISGSVSFDEWDNYVKTIEKMGLKDYLEIQNESYKRYKNS
jgi:putative aldouronate transport system substrate-binding protein